MSTSMPRRAQALAARGARIAPLSDELREVQCIADDEARDHEQWAQGLTPAQYLEALVDRAQRRKRGQDPAPAPQDPSRTDVP